MTKYAIRRFVEMIPAIILVSMAVFGFSYSW